MNYRTKRIFRVYGKKNGQGMRSLCRRAVMLLCAVVVCVALASGVQLVQAAGIASDADLRQDSTTVLQGKTYLSAKRGFVKRKGKTYYFGKPGRKPSV